MYEEFNQRFLSENSLEGEEWRYIQESEEKYMVSNMGRIFSRKRLRKNSNLEVGGCLLSPISTKKGYQVVSIIKNNKKILLKVHRLVAIAFIPRVVGLNIINHKDGDKANNIVSNLEWCNQLHNNIHAIETGLRVNASGEKAGASKYKDAEVLDMISMYNSLVPVKEIENKYNLEKKYLHRIIRKQSRIKLTKNIFIIDRKGSSTQSL